MDKQKTIEELGNSINDFEKLIRKNKGDKKLALFSEIGYKKDLVCIPFGLPDVDAATGIGGVPRGRVIELFGQESGGKSWLSLRLIASAQKMGLNAALIDLEHSFKTEWAISNGIDLDRLIYGDIFSSGNEALEYILDMIKNNIADLIVIDSTTALSPKEECEDNSGPSEIKIGVGQLARLMSNACRRISDLCGKYGTTVVFINQIREKVGILWGNPETTPGGRALKFYSSMRLEVRQISKIKEKQGQEEKIVGITSKFTVVKNKVAPPFDSALFEVYFYPETQSPLAILCKKAYELRGISRKNINGNMEYIWKDGNKKVETGCETFLDLSRWLENSGKDRILKLVEIVLEKSKEKDKEIDEELIQRVKDEFLFAEDDL